MTDEELKALVAGLAVSQVETNRQMRETDRKMQETDRRLDKLKDLYGGVGENIGKHAEQYFRDALAKKLIFGGIKYDKMIPNLSYEKGGDSAEFDIVLTNGKSVAIIEVKNRIHPNFIEELTSTKVKKFRTHFPEYSKYKLYLGVAGFSFGKEVIARAKESGVGILKQIGKSMEAEDIKLKAY